MEPGKVCRIYTNENHPEWCGFSYGSGSAIWNNGGDTATLRDGNGNFLVKLQVRIDYDEVTSFNWVIVGGTDAYVKLHGTGSGVGLPTIDPYVVLDLYDGKVHID